MCTRVRKISLYLLTEWEGQTGEYLARGYGVRTKRSVRPSYGDFHNSFTMKARAEPYRPYDKYSYFMIHKYVFFIYLLFGADNGNDFLSCTYHISFMAVYNSLRDRPPTPGSLPLRFTNSVWVL